MKQLGFLIPKQWKTLSSLNPEIEILCLINFLDIVWLRSIIRCLGVFGFLYNDFHLQICNLFTSYNAYMYYMFEKSYFLKVMLYHFPCQQKMIVDLTAVNCICNFL